MSQNQAKEIIERNTEETVTEEELEDLCTPSETSSPRAYIGFEPSGPCHLGNLLAIHKLQDIQEAGFQPVVLFADIHAHKNNKGSLDQIQAIAEYWQTTFKALGLEDTEYVLGSSFELEPEYQSLLNELKNTVTVNRAQRALGDIADDTSEATVGQLEYPLMQALDIPHLNVDLAVGGTDQRKIHMLARDELPQLGMNPPTALHFKLLSALTGTGDKMSSSKPETMFPLHASETIITERIDNAFLDPELPVEENPVLEIAERFIFRRNEKLEIDTEYVDRTYNNIDRLHSELQNWASDSETDDEIHPADVKTGVAQWMIAELAPVREAFKEKPKQLEALENR